MEAKERIILALDVSEYNEAIGVIKKFKERIEIFKVGAELFTSAGPKVVEEIHSMGKKVFLDLKFHDIPNTVARSALAVSRLGVFMFNIHTLGGLEMMQHTVRSLSEYCLEKNINRPKLIGVTILTSIDQDALRDELGISIRLNSQVRQLAVLAQRAGLDGIVASPEDALMLRSHFGKGFLIVTPGIRPSWATADDQKRTLTPGEAVSRGADYLVIGRSVTAQPDPLGALKRIEEELKGL
jgi:orotidine-5'-phosphate decarboxylase